MSKNPLSQSAELYEYIKSVSVRETVEMTQLRKQTASLADAVMQISPDQGQFMNIMVKLMQVERIIEIGTFTGYSALCMALALPENGQLIACDTSREWTNVGKPYWESAGVDHKIDLRIGPALDTLDQLLRDGQEEGFDLMFIDADKTNYDNYYEKGLKLIRPGGIIMIDNVFWGGAVIDKENTSKDTEAIRALNTKIAEDPRVDVSMIAVGDGLSLVRKK